MNKLLSRSSAVALLAWLGSMGSVALESDRNQDVQWSADGDSTMRLEGEIRILELTENVNVIQGTLNILGERAIFEYDSNSNELLRATIHGAPVRYRQQLDEAGNQVTGSSETIVFYADEDTGETVVELIGSASIRSPDTTWSCAAITYLVDRNIIPNSTGPCEGTLAGGN